MRVVLLIVGIVMLQVGRTQVYSDDMIGLFYDEVQELILNRPNNCIKIVFKSKYYGWRNRKVIEFMEDGRFKQRNKLFGKDVFFRQLGDSIAYIEKEEDRIARLENEGKRLNIQKDSGRYKVTIFKWDTSNISYHYKRSHYDSILNAEVNYTKNGGENDTYERLWFVQRNNPHSMITTYYDIKDQDTLFSGMDKWERIEKGDTTTIVQNPINKQYDNSLSKSKLVSKFIVVRDGQQRISRLEYFEEDRKEGVCHIKYVSSKP